MEEGTLITFCPRTEGDGMEALDVPITSDLKSACLISATNAMQTLSLLPSKPPLPTERIISLTPMASSLGTKPQPSSAAMEKKKAKFVPYEPYKAAVKPIVPLKKKINKRGNLQQTSSPEDQVNRKTSDKEWDSSQNFVCQQDYNKVVKEKEELEAQLVIQCKVLSN